MTRLHNTETQWYLPGRYYGCVDIDATLNDAAWDAAIEAHPVTQALLAEATKQASPCAFCEAYSTRVGTFLDAIISLAGKQVVCVYMACDACRAAVDLTKRIEERYHRDLWWLAREYDLDVNPLEIEDDADLLDARDAGPHFAWQMVLLFWERVPQEDRLPLLKEAFRRYTPAMREAVRELLEELDAAEEDSL